MPPQKRQPATPFQRQLAARLDVILAEDCDSHDAACKLDRAISRETKRVREVNSALKIGKAIIYEGAAWKIQREVDRFKFALSPQLKGK